MKIKMVSVFAKMKNEDNMLSVLHYCGDGVWTDLNAYFDGELVAYHDIDKDIFKIRTLDDFPGWQFTRVVVVIENGEFCMYEQYLSPMRVNGSIVLEYSYDR